jgi:hypothetical protein
MSICFYNEKWFENMDIRALTDRVEYFLKNTKEITSYTTPAYNWVKDKDWSYMADLYEKLWRV